MTTCPVVSELPPGLMVTSCVNRLLTYEPRRPQRRGLRLRPPNSRRRHRRRSPPPPPPQRPEFPAAPNCALKPASHWGIAASRRRFLWVLHADLVSSEGRTRLQLEAVAKLSNPWPESKNRAWSKRPKKDRSFRSFPPSADRTHRGWAIVKCAFFTWNNLRRLNVHRRLTIRANATSGGYFGPWNFALASRRSDTDHHPHRASLSLTSPARGTSITGQRPGFIVLSEREV